MFVIKFTQFRIFQKKSKLTIAGSIIVKQCPPAVCYIPNFITSHEEAAILSAVQTAPKPKWEQLSNRRLMNYGGVPHPKGMLAEPMPAWLQPYVEMVNSLGEFGGDSANKYYAMLLNIAVTFVRRRFR